MEIVTLAVKSRMRLLLNLKDDIAGFYAWRLVAIAAELDFGAASDTTVDVNVKHFPVDHCLLSVALLASILLLDNLTLAIAIGTHGLEPLDHGAHLAHHGLHTVAVAASAAPYSTLLSASTGALRADNRSLERELGYLALVDVLQRDLVRVVNGARLWGAPVLHPAEHTA